MRLDGREFSSSTPKPAYRRTLWESNEHACTCACARAHQGRPRDSGDLSVLDRFRRLRQPHVLRRPYGLRRPSCPLRYYRRRRPDWRRRPHFPPPPTLVAAAPSCVASPRPWGRCSTLVPQVTPLPGPSPFHRRTLLSARHTASPSRFFVRGLRPAEAIGLLGSREPQAPHSGATERHGDRSSLSLHAVAQRCLRLVAAHTEQRSHRESRGGEGSRSEVGAASARARAGRFRAQTQQPGACDGVPRHQHGAGRPFGRRFSPTARGAATPRTEGEAYARHRKGLVCSAEGLALIIYRLHRRPASLPPSRVAVRVRLRRVGGPLPKSR